MESKSYLNLFLFSYILLSCICLVSAFDFPHTIVNIDFTGNLTNLSEMQDVDTSGVTNGQLLIWNSATLKWEPDSAGAGDILAVNTNGPYLSGGATSGAVNLLLNEAYLNQTIDSRGGGDTWWGLNAGYIYNNSNSLDFNETKLNITIDSRDSDTTYTNGTGLSLVGNVFSLIGSFFSGSWNDLTDVPSGFSDGIDNDTAGGLTHLTNFTDDLGNRGYTSNSNFTNDEGYITSYTETDPHWSANQSSYSTKAVADTLYADISITGDDTFWNKSYADTLYRANSWDNFTGIPTATPSDADTTHFSTADQIYDWVIGLGYSTTTYVDNLISSVGNWSNDKSDYWNTSLDLDFSTDLNTTGNVTADYLLGDGSQLSNLPAGTTYSHLTNFTDDLGNRGYTSNSNFTNDEGYITSYTETDPYWSANSSTVARTGNCPSGQIVQNTTTSGVQCVSAGSGMASWVLAALGIGGSESITDGETVTLGSGNEYIDISRSTNSINYTLNETVADNRWVNSAGDVMTGDLRLSNSAINNTNNIQFNTSWADGTAEGRLQWNTEDGTLEFGLPGGNVNLQIGQEIVIRIKNEESSTINNGEVVYASTATGAIKYVKLANATNHTNAMKVVGIATEDIAADQFGYITVVGLVRDMNTSGFSDGQVVYLSEINGQITGTPPVAPNTRVMVGIVVKPHATEGILYAHLVPTGYITEISDVYSSGLTDNSILQYNSTSSRFEMTTYPTFTNVTADVFYGDVKLDTINGQTYNYLQDWIDTTQSAGKISGGTFTSNGDGTVNVSTGSGFIKVSDSAVANTILFDWDINTSVPLTDGVTNYIYIDYNSGSPMIKASESKVNNRDKILLGKIFREGTGLHTYEAGMLIAELGKNTLGRFTSIDGEFTRASGLILSETGSLNIAMTSGVAWGGLTMVNIGAFNSSIDTFEYYYYDGANWQESDKNQINNTHYNDIATGLEELTTNRYGVHWAYVDNDGHIMVVYGQGDYTLALATASQPPSDLPNHVTDFGELIGRIIVQKGDSTFTNVDIPSEFVFTSTGATDYNSLSNTPTLLSYFTDDLGDRGYTSNLNFTNDAGYYNSSDFSIANYYTSSQIDTFAYYNATDFDINDYLDLSTLIGFNYWNDTFATFNKTYADTLYADISQTDTNETARFNTLVGTDCGAGNYSYGFDANGLIQCREDTDTDTTYTNGTGISLIGNVFSLIGSFFSGSWNDLTDIPSGFADGIDNDTASSLTHLTNFTDDLGNRGYTHLGNFTDDIGVSADWDEISDITADGITDTQLEYDTGQHLTTTSNPTFNNVTVIDCVVFGNGATMCGV